MSNIAYIISRDGTLSLFLDKPYQVLSSHPRMEEIKQALKNNDRQSLIYLLDKPKQIENHFGGNLLIKNGSIVTLEGKVVDHSLTRRIVDFADQGLPVQSLLNFLENLLQTQDYIVSTGLYDFLAHLNLPITTDGHFLAWKAVTADFKDKRTKTFDNKPGSTVKMERVKVDNNRGICCSYGLHVGTLSYAKSFSGCNDKIVIVKVNPKNAVSVPTDCSFQKLRVCEYHVVCEYKEGNDNLSDPLYQVDDVSVVTVNDTQYVMPRIKKVKVKQNYHQRRDAKGRFCK